MKLHPIIARAASDLTIVGVMFVCTGGLPMLIAFSDRRGWLIQITGISATVFSVGPGVWYVIAAIFLRRGQQWAARTTYKVAMAQMIAVALALAGTFLSTSRIITGPRPMSASLAFVPAMLAMFFIPALIALLFSLRRATRHFVELPGFAVQALRVEPAPEEPLLAPPLATGSETV